MTPERIGDVMSKTKPRRIILASFAFLLLLYVEVYNSVLDVVDQMGSWSLGLRKYVRTGDRSEVALLLRFNF